MNKQETLFDLSEYDVSELVGSANDDLQDAHEIKKNGKKSKYCETWNFTDRQMEEHRASYRATMQAIFDNYPKAKRDQ